MNQRSRRRVIWFLGGGLVGLGFLARNAFSADELRPKAYVPLVMANSDGSPVVQIPPPTKASTVTPTVVPPTVAPSATPTVVPTRTSVPATVTPTTVVVSSREEVVRKTVAHLSSIQGTDGLIGDKITTRIAFKLFLRRGLYPGRVERGGKTLLEAFNSFVEVDKKDPTELSVDVIHAYPWISLDWAKEDIKGIAEDNFATLSDLANARWALKTLGLTEQDPTMVRLRERILGKLIVGDADPTALVKLSGVDQNLSRFKAADGGFQSIKGNDRLSTTAFCVLAEKSLPRETETFLLKRHQGDGSFLPDPSFRTLYATVLSALALMIS